MAQQRSSSRQGGAAAGRGRGGDRPGGRSSLESISAPYNFVPLAETVYCPDWGELVSHDLPFRDGVSGELAFRITAASPLLVGGEQQTASESAPGRVDPFRLPDGRYGIPGSSLKGMLRAVMEVAGFGRMRMVDDVRPGLRDISTSYVKAAYTDRVRDKVKTGFLRISADSVIEITPCSMARLDHRAAEPYLKCKMPVFPSGKSVAEKYGIWRQHCSRQRTDPDQLSFSIEGNQATTLGQGTSVGMPVFTGQISDSTRPKGKRWDFVFYDERAGERFTVNPLDWSDFLAIHGDGEAEGGKRSNLPWPGYWRERCRAGQRVPVFYVPDGDRVRIGLAYMPKLAGDFSVHDMIRHVHAEHLPDVAKAYAPDLAELIFGTVGGEETPALRGRVSIESALAEGEPKPQAEAATILNGPKPSYFPNYLSQRIKDEKGQIETKTYATYLSTAEHPKPTVRGFKRYPARPDGMVAIQVLSEQQKQSNKVQVVLNPLPKGTQFKGRVVFHNLRPVELGALLWTITWGGRKDLRHGLGMGKPFGFGQVQLELDHDRCTLLPNDPAAGLKGFDEATVQSFRDEFSTHMQSVVAGWKGTPQVSNLLAMADPAAAERFCSAERELRHLRLDPAARVNEFIDAKKAGLALLDYAQATGMQMGSAHPAGGSPAGGQGWPAWLQETVAQLAGEHNAPEQDVLRGKALAERWSILEDASVKAEVLIAIQAFWSERGWWDAPPGKSSKKARQIYGGDG